VKTYVLSEGSQVDLEVRPSVPASKLVSGFSAEVPDGWAVVFSPQKGTLTLAPQHAVLAQEP